MKKTEIKLQQKRKELALEDIKLYQAPTIIKPIIKATDMSAKNFLRHIKIQAHDFNYDMHSNEVDTLSEIIQENKTKFTDLVSSIEEYDASIFLFHARLICLRPRLANFKFQSLITAISSSFPSLEEDSLVDLEIKRLENEIQAKKLDISQTEMSSSIENVTKIYFMKMYSELSQSIPKLEDKLKNLNTSTSQRTANLHRALLENYKGKKSNLEEMFKYFEKFNVDLNKNFEYEPNDLENAKNASKNLINKPQALSTENKDPEKFLEIFPAKCKKYIKPYSILVSQSQFNDKPKVDAKPITKPDKAVMNPFEFFKLNKINMDKKIEIDSFRFPRVEERIPNLTYLTAKNLIIYEISKIQDFDSQKYDEEINMLCEIFHDNKSQLTDIIKSIHEYDASHFMLHARLLCHHPKVASFMFKSMITAISRVYPQFSTDILKNTETERIAKEIKEKHNEILLLDISSSIENVTRSYFTYTENAINNSIKVLEEKYGKIGGTFQKENIKGQSELKILKSQKSSLFSMFRWLNKSQLEIKNYKTVESVNQEIEKPKERNNIFELASKVDELLLKKNKIEVDSFEKTIKDNSSEPVPVSTKNINYVSRIRKQVEVEDEITESEDKESSKKYKEEKKIVNKVQNLSLQEKNFDTKTNTNSNKSLKVKKDIKMVVKLKAKDFLIYQIIQAKDFDYKKHSKEIDEFIKIIKGRNEGINEIIESIDKYDASQFLFQARLLCKNPRVSAFKFQSLIIAISNFFPVFSTESLSKTNVNEIEKKIKKRHLTVSSNDLSLSNENVTRKYFTKIESRINTNIKKLKEKSNNTDLSKSSEELQKTEKELKSAIKKKSILKNILLELNRSNVGLENFKDDTDSPKENKETNISQNMLRKKIDMDKKQNESDNENAIKSRMKIKEEDKKQSNHIFIHNNKKHIKNISYGVLEMHERKKEDKIDHDNSRHGENKAENNKRKSVICNIPYSNESDDNYKPGFNSNNNINRIKSVKIKNDSNLNDDKNRKSSDIKVQNNLPVENYTSSPKHNSDLMTKKLKDHQAPAKKLIHLVLRNHERLSSNSIIENEKFFKLDADKSALKKALKDEKEGNFYLIFNAKKKKYKLFYNAHQNTLIIANILKDSDKKFYFENSSHKYNSLQQLLLDQIRL